MLVPDSSPFEVKIAIAMLKRYKSLGIDRISSELIQAGGETLRSELHKLINSIWNKEKLPDQCKESVIVNFSRRAMRLRSYRGISLLSTSYSYKILPSILLSSLSS
jgi:hypothetical protein